jgi:hypothetical protein
MLKSNGNIPTTHPEGIRATSNKNIFTVTGNKAIAASADHMLNNNISPIRTSTIPRKGIKYPVATKPFIKASAAPVGAGAEAVNAGKNFIAPNRVNVSPVNTLRIVYSSLFLILPIIEINNI